MNPVYCALDTPDIAAAEAIAAAVGPHVGGLKLGLEFFTANGPSGVRRIAARGRPIFLDLKLHDIPNTVAGAVRSILDLEAAFLTIHASGGRAMLKAAAEAAAEAGARRPRILGVTVLTSLDAGDMEAVGQDLDVRRQTHRLADLALDAGLDGLVCSPHEVAELRERFGSGVVLMVPGIRPRWSAAGDQKRFMTPSQAMSAGASAIVVGRPITTAVDPSDAARRIAEELGV